MLQHYSQCLKLSQENKITVSLNMKGVVQLIVSATFLLLATFYAVSSGYVPYIYG